MVDTIIVPHAQFFKHIDLASDLVLEAHVPIHISHVPLVHSIGLFIITLSVYLFQILHPDDFIIDPAPGSDL
jgi:hypothetical protein